jgi:prepilin-type N-terminal cleavage/methylation domain-containing protein
MKPNLKKAVTLLELLIAIVLLSVVTIGISSIDIFSRSHVLSSQRRTTLQNEASFVLGHMTKEITRAIGNTRIDPAVVLNINNSEIRIRTIFLFREVTAA